MRKEYTIHSKEEKLEIVKRYLSGESPVKLHEETGISDGNIRKWKRQYLSGGEAALENKKKPENPLSKYERRKELSREEQLEYQIELLRRKLLKKEAEVLRFHFHYWECDNLNFVIEQAVHYFNYQRPVRKLNGKPPVLFRFGQAV